MISNIFLYLALFLAKKRSIPMVENYMVTDEKTAMIKHSFFEFIILSDDLFREG